MKKLILTIALSLGIIAVANAQFPNAFKPYSYPVGNGTSILQGTSSPTFGYLTATSTKASFLPYASSTAFTASMLCIDTCKSAWPAAGAASTTLLNDWNNFTGRNVFSYASTSILTLNGILYDGGNSAGTAGYVLMSTASGAKWVASTTFTGPLSYLNGQVSCSTCMTAVTADSPLSGSGTSASHLVVANAAADGSTKGVATFTAADFDDSTGLISIDYANGTAASISAKGFLTAAGYNLFNGKIGTSTALGTANLGQVVYLTNANTPPLIATAATTSCSLPSPLTGSFVALGSSCTTSFGTLTVGNGGTGATTVGQGWIYSTGGTNAWAASTSPTVNAIIATSTALASQFVNASTTLFTVATTLYAPQYASFSYSTSTAWTGTTTIPLGPAFIAETWNQIKCFTDTGTLNVSFYDGTNRMNLLNASTTIGTFNFTTNNTFTAGETRYVDIGTPASSPLKISCTVKKTPL